MIETTFFATSEKLWSAACSTFGGPRSSSAQMLLEEALDRGAALGRAQVAARGLAVLGADGQHVALPRRTRVRSSASRAFRISIRKRCLGR